MIVECRSCKRNVIPKNDGKCPSCGAPTAGSVEVPIGNVDVERAAEQQRFDEERRLIDEHARKLDERGGQLTLGGTGLAILGLLVTAASFASARPGESYTLWTGGMIAGVAMIIRGQAMKSRARDLRRG